MSVATTAAFYDEGYNRKRQPWLVYPLFCWIATAILFPLLKGGEGAGSMDGQQRLMGFNTTVPTAENTSIKQPDIDHPAYGGRIGGQVLSDITNTQKIPAANQLQNFPGDESASTNPTTANNTQNTATAAPSVANAYSAPTTQTKRRGQNYTQQPGFKYHRAQPYYVNSNQTDQQQEQQLNAYQSTRQANQPSGQLPGAASETPGAGNQMLGATSPAGAPHNFIKLDDNATVSRLDQGTPSPVVENPFNTAPVGGNRQQSIATTLQSSDNRQPAITTLIPAVVHDDQSVKAGQPVKLRLTKAVVVNGIRVPANTIVHATCKPDGDRIYLIVQSLQMSGQLIPLNLEAVDVDGGEGVNAPGLSDQLGGQLKSSAVQGVNIPTRSMLVNSVLNAARFGASSSIRQATIHLKGGYQLYLKSI